MSEDSMAKARAAKAAKAAAKQEETVEQRRARLMAELADLPAPEIVGTLEPGSTIGEGANAQKVPFTRRWFENNTEMVEFIPPEDGKVKLNGVKYVFQKGKKTKIPAPHYAAWEDAQNRLAAGQRMYDPPPNLVTNIPGYSSPIFRMGEGLLDPIPDTE